MDDNERGIVAVFLQEFRCTLELNVCLFRPLLHHLDIEYGTLHDAFIIVMEIWWMKCSFLKKCNDVVSCQISEMNVRSTDAKI